MGPFCWRQSYMEWVTIKGQYSFIYIHTHTYIYICVCVCVCVCVWWILSFHIKSIKIVKKNISATLLFVIFRNNLHTFWWKNNNRPMASGVWGFVYARLVLILLYLYCEIVQYLIFSYKKWMFIVCHDPHLSVSGQRVIN